MEFLAAVAFLVEPVEFLAVLESLAVAVKQVVTFGKPSVVAVL